ncbi:MAG: hypothetical protein COV67_07180 [Nitrospinae bacterium CG11_big_fil_rev_8_21_14_0_20_56_8]|nr:MAG: hypothetical protein COV67_07180 [Nitrospinae bacterium CG11_big_fil_rev_8_21_14_0_20_56_8]
MKRLDPGSRELQRKSPAGFTLIEVLIVIAMISFGMLAYGILSGSIASKNTASKKSSVAATLAQDKVEFIKNLGLTYLLSDANGLDSPEYDSVTQTWTATVGGEVVDAEGNTGTSGAMYTRTWSINQIGSSNYATTVTATVTWQENGTQTETLQTIISQ